MRNFVFALLLFAVPCASCTDTGGGQASEPCGGPVLDVDGSYLADVVLDRTYPGSDVDPEHYEVANMLVVVDQKQGSVVWWGVVGVPSVDSVAIYADEDVPIAYDWSWWYHVGVEGTADLQAASLVARWEIHYDGRQQNVQTDYTITNLRRIEPPKEALTAAVVGPGNELAFTRSVRHVDWRDPFFTPAPEDLPPY